MVRNSNSVIVLSVRLGCAQATASDESRDVHSIVFCGFDRISADKGGFFLRKLLADMTSKIRDTRSMTRDDQDMKEACSVDGLRSLKDNVILDTLVR